MSHLLPTLDVGEDDESEPQEDVPGPENDLLLPNTQSIVPNSSADDTEINQILQELVGQSHRNMDVPASFIHTTPIDEAAGKEQIFAIAFPTLYPFGHTDFVAPRQ